MPESFKLPLFPLNTVLFPGQTLPLHIFEPRYRQMIAELEIPSLDALLRELNHLLHQETRVHQIMSDAAHLRGEMDLPFSQN